MSRHTFDSPEYRQALAHIQATGPLCVICRHPGSDSIHHLHPTSQYPELAADPRNWYPSPGINGCPHCPPNNSRDKRRRGKPRRCNQEQGSKLHLPQPTPQARRW